MTADLICPGCGRVTTGKDLFGLIEPEVYDGVIIWTHGCGHSWPRFPEGHPRHDWAVAAIAKHTPKRAS